MLEQALEPGHLPDPWEVVEQDEEESVYRATGLVDESFRTDHGKRDVVVTKWDDHDWFVGVFDPADESEIRQGGPSFHYRQDAENMALGLMTKRTESTGTEPYDAPDESTGDTGAANGRAES